MTDLRTQARYAARADSDFDNRGMSNLGHHRMRGADIAADFYEPLLRQLAEDIVSLAEDAGMADSYMQTDQRLLRAKEVLS